MFIFLWSVWFLIIRFCKNEANCHNWWLSPARDLADSPRHFDFILVGGGGDMSAIFFYVSGQKIVPSVRAKFFRFFRFMIVKRCRSFFLCVCVFQTNFSEAAWTRVSLCSGIKMENMFSSQPSANCLWCVSQYSDSNSSFRIFCGQRYVHVLEISFHQSNETRDEGSRNERDFLRLMRLK